MVMAMATENSTSVKPDCLFMSKFLMAL